MNLFLLFILFVLIGGYILDYIVERLNILNMNPVLPEEFKNYYDKEKYKKSQKYLKENTEFGLVNDGVSLVLLLAFIFAGGFNYVDNFARKFMFGDIITGLIFAAVLMFLSQIIKIPFSAYHTFVIEEKYGFNKTTPKIFVLDIFKSWFLIAIIGGIVFVAIVLFFTKLGAFAWFYFWIAFSFFELFLVFVAPVVIMPLFNKFIPLEDGKLKGAIENYAAEQNFKMKGLFKMDGSKRSTKSNAYFTGFGKLKRIVLFDTLIERHTVDELVSVLAHEIGHYKKHHILQNIILSIITNGIMFFLLSLFINNPLLFDAFRMDYLSVYASLFFFGFLFTPISMFVSILGNVLSRKNEYEADAYAVSTYKKPNSMIDALKKLSVDNLSNLTPHKFKVFLEYSHPPVLERIKAIRENS